MDNPCEAFLPVMQTIGNESVWMAPMAVMGAEMLGKSDRANGRQEKLKDTALQERIGGRVGILRRRNKLTQEELAQRARIHRNSVSRVEFGGGCSAATLFRIATALGVKMDDLLADAQHIVCLSVEPLQKTK